MPMLGVVFLHAGELIISKSSFVVKTLMTHLQTMVGGCAVTQLTQL